ncbi:putative formin-like protein 6 isoform X2 [Iris pallida]|uniref:Formin-like protein 6 isoform X2 n=1 Tax=Iris pallida TaxID=29817 RepID=A0AAX6FYG6_IRIPA|nr:putative formin-like protein 6 isoform X2 [Iris pallida]
MSSPAHRALLAPLCSARTGTAIFSVGTAGVREPRVPHVDRWWEPRARPSASANAATLQSSDLHVPRHPQTLSLHRRTTTVESPTASRNPRRLLREQLRPIHCPDRASRLPGCHPPRVAAPQPNPSTERPARPRLTISELIVPGRTPTDDPVAVVPSR